jgi:hypothetical protein
MSRGRVYPSPDTAPLRKHDVPLPPVRQRSTLYSFCPTFPNASSWQLETWFILRNVCIFGLTDGIHSSDLKVYESDDALISAFLHAVLCIAFVRFKHSDDDSTNFRWRKCSHTRTHGLTLEHDSFHGHNREKLKFRLEVLPRYLPWGTLENQENTRLF